MPTLFGLQGEALQTAMGFTVAIPSFLAMGFSLSFGGGITGYPSFYNQFPQTNSVTTTGHAKEQASTIKGVVVACISLGAALGCFATIYLGNRLGRRKTTVCGAVVALVGTVLFCTAFAMAQLVVGRIILGAGLGMMSSTIPVWRSETSKTHRRGQHVIIAGVMIACGQALAAWLNFGFSHIASDSSFKWRLPAATTGILALIILFFTFTFPESPRWLVFKGRVDEARVNLALYDGYSANSEPVEAALASIITMHDQATENKATFRQLFQQGEDKMLYRIIVAALPQVWASMAGSGLITWYAEQIFANIGLDHETSKILAACVLTLKAICSFIPLFVIERFGRRRMFYISGGGMTACLLVLAVTGSQSSPTYLAPAYVGAAASFVFVAFYPWGLLGTNFLYSQEVISTPYRAPASGVSTAVHWIAAFVVALTTPVGFNNLGWKFYFPWMAVAASIIPIVYWFFPETTGLSMEQIDAVFRDTPNIYKTVATAQKARSAVLEVRQGAVEVFDGDEKRQKEREQVERV